VESFEGVPDAVSRRRGFFRFVKRYSIVNACSVDLSASFFGCLAFIVTENPFYPERLPDGGGSSLHSFDHEERSSHATN
jgi:hypothetical protein